MTDWTEGYTTDVATPMAIFLNSTPWIATDFNPAHAALAQELANASGAAAHGTRLYDDAFADFCQRTDLPDFSFIGVHGIWSWISDANRVVIVDFVRRRLRVGGVLYDGDRPALCEGQPTGCHPYQSPAGHESQLPGT